MNTKNFIVPHDFTQVADNALDHAIATAKPLNAEIYVLHVVSKEKQIDKAEKQLAEVLNIHVESGVKLIPTVRVACLDRLPIR